MIDKIQLSHHIQKHIVGYLTTHKEGRFRDMRPSNVDTNLYAYHLKLVQSNGLVEKCDSGYTLSERGQSYVDRTNAISGNITLQPKIITALVIQDGYGKVLMTPNTKQPYIDLWKLPLGKVHSDDTSIAAAANRERIEKVGRFDVSLAHVGDCYIRTQGNLMLPTFAHIFYGIVDDPFEVKGYSWIDPHALPQLNTAPGMSEIIARTFFRDQYFFEEFTID